MHPLVERIAAVTGPNGIRTAENDVAPHFSDWHGRHAGRALCVALPRSTEEVARIVTLCASAGEPVVPQGGNTGVCGGSVPSPAGRGIVLSRQRMRAIRSVDPAGDVLIAEAGCVLADVQAAARSKDRLFPLTLGAEGSCQIGGNVSTNAGGIAALRYGSMRDLVLGLEVVLPDGRIWDGLRVLRKDNTGYHLKDIFVGAEGTLGIVTAAALRLFPLPKSGHLAWLAVGSVEAATALLGHARKAFGAGLAACELMSASLMDLVCHRFSDLRPPFATGRPWLVLLHVEDMRAGAEADAAFEAVLAQTVADGVADDAVIAKSLAQADMFWRLRHGVTEANRARGFNVTHDIALPVNAVATFIKRADVMTARRFPDAEIHSVTHLGDGNVHYTVTIPHERMALLDDPAAFAASVTAAVHDLAVEMDGSFAAEHGIGQRYLASLQRHKSPVELDLFARLKAAFDPQGIMNPGKVLAHTPAAHTA